MLFRDLEDGEEAVITSASNTKFEHRIVRREGKCVLLLDYAGQPTTEAPDRWSGIESIGITVVRLYPKIIRTLIKGG